MLKIGEFLWVEHGETGEHLEETYKNPDISHHNCSQATSIFELGSSVGTDMISNHPYIGTAEEHLTYLCGNILMLEMKFISAIML